VLRIAALLVRRLHPVLARAGRAHCRAHWRAHWRALAVGAALAPAAPRAAVAQSVLRESDADVAARLASWIQVEAPPGGEWRRARELSTALPGWQRDVVGNLVRRVGSGTPRRVVACAMDVPGFVVSQITDDGFVRLHRAGVPSHALWDQFHEAQQVHVLTSRGDVTGVVAIANGHFARQHRGDTAIATVDGLWVDLGVESRAQALALGVALLDPVVVVRPHWTYEGFASGPAAGARAGCAAVASAAEAFANASAQAPAGETVFVLSTQRSFGWAGLGGVVARLGAVDRLLLVDEGRDVSGTRTTALPLSRLGASRSRLARALSGVLRRDTVEVLTPKVRYAGSLVESIHADDARALVSGVMQSLGVAGIAAPLVAPVIDTIVTLPARTDAYGAIERTFFRIADLAGVPGHEWRVRESIRQMLPAWAAASAVVDTAGNLIVAAGPDRDSVAFLAHMDEVSFEVEGILPDGRVRLARRGGVVTTAWEGQPAMLHFDRDARGQVAESLRGVFVPRDSARSRPVNALVAWFGTDSAGLVTRGVRVGSAVTAYKHATRLANARLTARGSDDRTGSTALLHALQRINPATLTHKVLFVWSTREEGGLLGASAFGAEHGRNLVRVYSIDTFVSSDTPLESPMFAFAPLGRGAVLRGLDDGSITPRSERERILRLANVARIPVQVGTTHGSTDGSAIAAYGAHNVGLSWPGRYSHAPGEVLDLRDVDALIRLIVAAAVAR